MTVNLIQGDCLQKLKDMADASIDAVVTDPPAGIGFMGREWDKDKGGRREWVAWLSGIMAECLRVLKPGGHAFVWALPRTSHWTATALEDAGFEVRDCCVHIFGSGFPKSSRVNRDPRFCQCGESARNVANSCCQACGKPVANGFGTSLKPASEHWWLCRKPLIGTVAANVLAHGTGALNIDGCRVAHANAADLEKHAASVAAIKARGGSMANSWANSSDLSGANDVSTAGRWPSNVIFSHLPECRQVGFRKVKGGAGTTCSNRDAAGKCLGHENAGRSTSGATYHGPETATVNRTETVASWECAEGCAVAELDGQSGESKSVASGYNFESSKNDNPTRLTHNIKSGVHYGDTGGASRFFPAFRYQAKPATRERWAYLTCDCEAGIIPTWVNEVRNQLEKMGVTSPPKATCAETTAGDFDSNTSSSGSALTAPFLPAGKSTTETRTNSTIDWKTYSLSPQSNTSGCIADVNFETGYGSSHVQSVDNTSPLTRNISTYPEKAGRCMGVAVPAIYASLLREKSCGSCDSPIKGRGHETVKPVELMRWLVRLVTPPGGVVLDPFTGSGTTGVACMLEGFSFIGIEREPEYMQIATARIAHAKDRKQATDS